MATPSERHNELTREFVTKIARETKSAAEMCVILESTILGSMLVCSNVYRMKPAVSAGLIEAAVQRAIERYTGTALKEQGE